MGPTRPGGRPGLGGSGGRRQPVTELSYALDLRGHHGSRPVEELSRVLLGAHRLHWTVFALNAVAADDVTEMEDHLRGQIDDFVSLVR